MLESSRVLMIGFGSVGQTLLPLLLKHFALHPKQLTIIAADENGRQLAESYRIDFINCRINPKNYTDILASKLGSGDLLINVAVGVSSFALASWCQEHNARYLDTSVEPWEREYQTRDKHASITNHSLRREILKLQRNGAPTAIVAHGANPGLISHFVKVGLLNLARLKNITHWHSLGDLARRLDIKVIQVAERDTQAANISFNNDVFYNTWSVEGLLAEAQRYGELGWGSHENDLPECAYHFSLNIDAGICATVSGAELMVKSWLPGSGEQAAYLIAHHEALSIAEFLTVVDDDSHRPLYRPTVFYAYSPSYLTCQSLQHWIANRYEHPREQEILLTKLESGTDQMGALFLFPGGCYWYGSTLHLETARQFAPHGNATTLQVAAGILGALTWMYDHPNAGVVEAESIDTDTVMQIAHPYLGEVTGVFGTWQPHRNRRLQFDAFLLSPHYSLDRMGDVREHEHG